MAWFRTVLSINGVVTNNRWINTGYVRDIEVKPNDKGTFDVMMNDNLDEADFAGNFETEALALAEVERFIECHEGNKEPTQDELSKEDWSRVWEVVKTEANYRKLQSAPEWKALERIANYAKKRAGD